MAKPKMTPIEQELSDATGVKPKPKESEQDYLERMQAAAEDLSEKDWDALSDDAQTWANNAATAVKKKKDLPAFPDDQPPVEEEESAEAEGEEGDEEEAPAEEEAAPKTKTVAGKKGAAAKKGPTPKNGGAAKKGAAPKKGATAAKETKERAPGTPKASGVKVEIKKAILKDPQASVEDVMAALKKAGQKDISRPTVAGIRAEFRHSLAVLIAEGKVKGIEL